MPPSTRLPQSSSRPTASTTTPTTRPRSPETHESLQRRNAAAEILQSYEMLSWFALDRNESLAQTRLHFLSQLAGFTKEDEKAKVDWKTDISPHNPNALPTSFFTGEIPLGGEGRRKSSAAGKGKERASLGGGGRASPGRTSLGGEGGGVGSSGRKKRRSAGLGS